MDLQTLYRYCLRELRVDSTSIPQTTADDVMLSIAESLRYHRSIETWFNKKSYTFSIEENVSRYPLPKDFIGLVGKVFYLTIDPDDSTQVSYQRVLGDGGQDMIEEFRFVASDFSSDLIIFRSGQSEMYAVDETNNEMILSPTPNSTGDHLIRFRYLADLGTITYKHDGTNWIFYLPDSITAVTSSSTFSNAWFTDGFDMLRERTMYYLWSRNYGGSEEGEVKAQRSLLQWQDAKSRINAEASRKQSLRSVRPWI